MTIRFTLTACPAGKKGTIPKDANGYYRCNIGALNTLNSAGEYYTAKEVTKLFTKNSLLMERVEKGRLKIEVGHPVREPWMNEQDYFIRHHQLLDTNICGVFGDIILGYDEAEALKHTELNRMSKTDPMAVKEGHQGDIIPIIGLIKPDGPHAHVLEKAFENPLQDVCFSVRGITDDYWYNKKLYRPLTHIFTWDYVVEPGIDTASKWNALSLESKLNTRITKQLIDGLKSREFSKLATEDSKQIAQEIIKLYHKQVHSSKAVWTGW